MKECDYFRCARRSSTLKVIWFYSVFATLKHVYIFLIAFSQISVAWIFVYLIAVTYFHRKVVEISENSVPKIHPYHSDQFFGRVITVHDGEEDLFTFSIHGLIDYTMSAKLIVRWGFALSIHIAQCIASELSKLDFRFVTAADQEGYKCRYVNNALLWFFTIFNGFVQFRDFHTKWSLRPTFTLSRLRNRSSPAKIKQSLALAGHSAGVVPCSGHALLSETRCDCFPVSPLPPEHDLVPELIRSRLSDSWAYFFRVCADSGDSLMGRGLPLCQWCFSADDSRKT